MPTLMNGKTEKNIIRDIGRFVTDVMISGKGIISAAKYRGKYTYWDMSNAYVSPNDKGDEMYMVNNHNGIGPRETHIITLETTLTEYLHNAVDAQKTSKAIVLVVRETPDIYVLDNMRMYETEEMALEAGTLKNSTFIREVNTGEEYSL